MTRHIMVILALLLLVTCTACANSKRLPPLGEYRCIQGQVWRLSHGLWIETERFGRPIYCANVI